MNLTSTAALKVPPEMLTELALGMEDGVAVAQRHGFSAADFTTLIGQPWFMKAIQVKRDSLEKDGNIFRAKMAMLAEDLLVDLWMTAKQSESGSLKHDVAKLLTKVADLEPKNTHQIAASGTGYQIIISIPEGVQAAANASERPSDGSDFPPTPTLDLTPNHPPELPEGPRPLIVPDFDLTSELANEVAPYGTPEDRQASRSGEG